jgi:DNA-binding NarL/FixJ family response regulator
MDIRMPNLDGIEATRRLAGPGVADPVRVLILTTYDVDEYVFAALRAGAWGFLLKHTSPEGLVEAVRTVASGDGLIAPESPGASSPSSPARPPPRPRRPSWTASPTASARSWSWSPAAAPTPRSPATWWLARPRSRLTSAGS